MGDWVEAHFFLTAFMDLSTTRQYGAMGGMYSISWRNVIHYAKKQLGLNRESRQHFWRIIRDVDNRYVKMMNEKAAPPKKGPTPNERRPLREKSRREI